MTNELTAVNVLHNGVVLTGGDPLVVLPDGAVAWSDDRIIAVGRASELNERFPNAQRLDACGGIILPGLVNLHHHLYSALARGLAPSSQPTKT